MEYLRTDIGTKFPQTDAAIERDTSSFLHVVGKIKKSQWKIKAEGFKHNWCFTQSFRHHS